MSGRLARCLLLGFIRYAAALYSVVICIGYVTISTISMKWPTICHRQLVISHSNTTPNITACSPPRFITKLTSSVNWLALCESQHYIANVWPAVIYIQRITTIISSICLLMHALACTVRYLGGHYSVIRRMCLISRFGEIEVLIWTA